LEDFFNLANKMHIDLHSMIVESAPKLKRL